MKAKSSVQGTRGGVVGQKSGDSFKDQIGYSLRVAQDAAVESLQKRRRDFRPGRLAILSAISDQPGLNQTELAEVSKRAKSTITPAMVQLERRGLIERRRVDQRTYGIYLTSSGEKLHAELRQMALQHDQLLTDIIGNAKKAKIIQLLGELTEALRKL